jgi:hypothetical protein
MDKMMNRAWLGSPLYRWRSKLADSDHVMPEVIALTMAWHFTELFNRPNSYQSTTKIHEELAGQSG